MTSYAGQQQQLQELQSLHQKDLAQLKEKHQKERQGAVLSRTRGLNEEENSVRNGVVRVGDLLDEILKELGSKIYKKLGSHLCPRPRRVSAQCAERLWMNLASLLDARGGTKINNSVTFNNLNDVVGVFHPLRLGFKALVKIKDASNKDKDSSCVWVTKARPMIFHYLSGKGVRVDFYFQHFNEQGLALTSSLR